MHTFYCSHRRLAGLAAAFALLLISSQIVLAQPAGSTFYGTGALSLPFNTGVNNSAFGFNALNFASGGYNNTAIGSYADSSSDGDYMNLAIGYGSLNGIVGIRSQNTAIGVKALPSSTDGAFNNVAIGYNTLYTNQGTSNNVAIGFIALYFVKASNNTAIGENALVGCPPNSTGNGGYNTASGFDALERNCNGYLNTASGFDALEASDTGYLNTADGMNSLHSNAYGYYNTANGVQALYSNFDGNQNTASGVNALSANISGSANTAFGYAALYRSTSTNNIGVGDHAGQNITTGNNNIDIGSGGNSADDGVIRIGTTGQTKTFISGISGKTATGGVQVYVTSSGQLGTQNSSQRFKQDIQSIGDASDKLLQLRPVSFRYIEAAADGSKPLQYGLIAEEVAKIYPELVQLDQEGKPYTVYYHLLTPLMLSEFQKVHGMTQARQEKIATQQSQAVSFKQQLTEESAEVFTRLQQLQQQDVTDMAVLQQQLTQLDTLVQASNGNAAPAAKVALVSGH